ncbi:MAG TPA: DUF1398 family protein [Tepidisphaeraceae bacterium]|jgi:uncharacterized protein YbcV (DUF1398 family)|nr:DUF1398 family protein [Tepidisphaeraceae bacterium]
MNPNTVAVMEQCTSLSLQGMISFPEVVRKLHEVGVERYHADFSRGEKTYYLPGGESHVASFGHLPEPIAESFSPAGVEAAIKEIQRGTIVYAEFLRRVMAAGCVGYFVQITGRRALYFGRKGEIHLEPFPGAS